MDKDIFLVMTDDVDERAEIWERAEQMGNSEVHELSPDLLLLVTTETTAGAVVKTLVPNYDDTDTPPTIVVFKLNGSYAGYYHKHLWNWLESASSSAVNA